MKRVFLTTADRKLLFACAMEYETPMVEMDSACKIVSALGLKDLGDARVIEDKDREDAPVAYDLEDADHTVLEKLVAKKKGWPFLLAADVKAMKQRVTTPVKEEAKDEKPDK